MKGIHILGIAFLFLIAGVAALPEAHAYSYGYNYADHGSAYGSWNYVNLPYHRPYSSHYYGYGGYRPSYHVPGTWYGYPSYGWGYNHYQPYYSYNYRYSYYNHYSYGYNSYRGYYPYYNRWW